MSGVSLEEARERVRLVDAALSEEGFAGLVKLASAEDRAIGVSCFVIGRLPDGLGMKAGHLAHLKQFGPEWLAPCLNHRLHPGDWGNCPKYPVGALLAGAIEGCAR